MRTTATTTAKLTLPTQPGAHAVQPDVDGKFGPGPHRNHVTEDEMNSIDRNTRPTDGTASAVSQGLDRLDAVPTCPNCSSGLDRVVKERYDEVISVDLNTFEVRG